MNFITNLPLSKRYGRVYNTVLIIINKYIKILRYILITKIIDSTGLIELIFEKVILKFRVPDRIISNRGSIFINTF